MFTRTQKGGYFEVEVVQKTGKSRFLCRLQLLGGERCYYEYALFRVNATAFDFFGAVFNSLHVNIAFSHNITCPSVFCGGTALSKQHLINTDVRNRARTGSKRPSLVVYKFVKPIKYDLSSRSSAFRS